MTTKTPVTEAVQVPVLLLKRLIPKQHVDAGTEKEAAISPQETKRLRKSLEYRSLGLGNDLILYSFLENQRQVQGLTGN